MALLYIPTEYVILIVKFIKNNLTFQVVCTYLDNLIFLQNLIARVEKRVPTIWVGDFNTILDTNTDLNSNLDLRNRATHPGPRVTNRLTSIVSEYGLIDTFRAANSKQESFNFVNNSGGSRLDYCLLSSHFGKIN